jgi:hypothetical protein
MCINETCISVIFEARHTLSISCSKHASRPQTNPPMAEVSVVWYFINLCDRPASDTSRRSRFESPHPQVRCLSFPSYPGDILEYPSKGSLEMQERLRCVWLSAPIKYLPYRISTISHLNRDKRNKNISRAAIARDNLVPDRIFVEKKPLVLLCYADFPINTAQTSLTLFRRFGNIPNWILYNFFEGISRIGFPVNNPTRTSETR